MFQVGLSVVLAQTVALVGVGFVFKGVFDRELRRNITSHIEIPARLMARGELDAEAIANLPAMEQILGEKLGLGAIVDNSGLIYRSLDTNHVGDNLVSRGLVTEEHFNKALREAAVVEFHEAGGQCLLSVLPITNARGYAPDRYLALKIDTAQLDRRADQLLQWYIIGAIALFAATSLLLFAMYRRHLDRPMGEVLDAIHRLEDGDFAARVPESAERNEFNRLAEGINQMADKLEHSDVRIQSSEKKFETLVEQAADAIYLHDVDGGIVEVNRRACELLGYSREEMVGMNVADIVVGRMRSEVLRIIQQVVRDGAVQHESSHRKKDGSVCPVEVRAAATVVNSERMVITIVRDITERKRTMEALDQSRRQLQLIADNLPSLIAYVGRDEKYIFVNKAYARNFQRFDRDIVGRKIRDVVGADAYRQAKPHIDGVLKGRTEVFQETSAESSGKARSLLVSYVPHREKDEVVGFFGLIHDISELERTNEALRTSEARFRQLVETSPYSIHEIARNGSLGAINPAGRRMLNIKHERQLDGVGFIDMVSQRDRDRVGDLVKRGFSGKTSEFEYTSAQGQYVAASLVPLTDAQGNITDLMGVSRDITAAKKAENRLRFTQLTVDQARLAIFWCHPDGMFYFVNDTACKWLQFSRQELAGKHVADINPEFPRETWPAHWAEIKERGVLTMESVHQRKDGSIYPVEIHSNYVQFEDQEFNLAFVLDISAEREARNQLRDSEEQYRALFENSADAIFLIDVEEPLRGRIVSANRIAAEMHGYSPAELLNLKIGELDTEDSAAQAPDRIRKLLDKGTLNFEVDHRRRDGSIIPMDVTASIVSLKGHKYILAINRDITQRRQTEGIRTAAQAEVGRHLASVQALSNRLETVREEERKRISREIHDELGQMLTVLKMNLHGIEQHVLRLTDEKIRNPLEERVVEADALTDETIQAVREIALRVRPSVLDELGLIPAIRQECKRFSAKAELNCKIMTDDDFPSLDDSISTTLFRLCQEFLTNIARHAGAENVSVNLAMDQGSVVLGVTDDGRGFPPGPTDRPGHLGLVGARERAGNLGGAVEINSKPGEGANVLVRIPINENGKENNETYTDS